MKADNSNIHNNLYKLLKELDEIANKNNLKYNLAYGTALGAIREKGFIEWDTDIDIMVSIDDYEKFCSILEREKKDDFCLYTRDKSDYHFALFNRFGFTNVKPDELHIDIFPMVGAPKSKFMKSIFCFFAYAIHMGNTFKHANIKKVTKKASIKAVILYTVGKLICLPIPGKLFEYFFNKLTQAYPIFDSDDVYTISGTYKKKEFIPKNWIMESEYKEYEGLNLPVPKEWNKYLMQMYGDYMTPRR